MSDKQRQNTIILFVVGALITYVIKGQFVDKPMATKLGLQATIQMLEEKGQNLTNLKARVQSLSVGLNEAGPGLKELAERFPSEGQDSKVFSVLSRLTSEIPEVQVTKRHQLSKENLVFRSPWRKEEDVERTYRDLLPAGESGRTMEGDKIIANTVKITKIDAKMDFTADYQGLMKLLAGLHAQRLYFDVTEIDLWAPAREKSRVRGILTVSTLAFGGPVVMKK